MYCFARVQELAVCLLPFCLSFFVSAANVYGQPDELVQLEQQLEQIQKRIAEKKNSQNDSFGQRARAVGRQRLPSPPVQHVDDTLVIRFYDLSDLFSVSPQYPATIPKDFHGARTANEEIFESAKGAMTGGGFGGGGGGVFSVPPTPMQQQAQSLSLSAARVSVEGLIEAIKKTVAPDDWGDDNDEASINVLGNTLLISANDSMHEQIANLLNLIREHWGKLKTVSVQAFWIKSTAAEIEELLDDKEANRVSGKVADAKWKLFFKKSNEENRIAYSASLSGHNGQTLHTVSGRRQYLVVDANPVFATTRLQDDDGDRKMRVEKTVVGMHPVRNSFQQGAALQISPLCTRGGNFVILDLQTRVNELLEQDDESTPTRVVGRSKSGDEISVPLDHGDYVSYRLSTTIRCPKDEVILAGGMTYDSSSEAEQTNLYFFVRSGIHTIEEDVLSQVAK